MKGFARAMAVGALVLIPLVAIGKALDFGGLAMFGVVIVSMFAASLADRDGFYGPRETR
jgi:hypothetical protein